MAQRKNGAVAAKFRPYLTDLGSPVRSGGGVCLPFIGRGAELESVTEILLRQWKNNPLLVGKPGAGKTALVHELAARIAAGRVPPQLRGRRICELAINAFIYSHESTAGLVRDFEELFQMLKRDPGVILFLDELHFPSLEETSGREAAAHLTGLLKNHLASRDLTLIATATPDEYDRRIKPDEAFSSSFEVLAVREPDRAAMAGILSGVRPHFERYYGIRIQEPLLARIHPLACRFNPSRAFPDKAIELLDTACAKAAVKKRRQLSMDEVYESLSGASRLPVAIVRKDPRRHILGLQPFLESELVDQRDGLTEIARVLKIFHLERASEPQRPMAILLFLGPAGIGKSLVAGKIAQYLFGTREKLRTIPMAGYKRPSDWEKLIAQDAGKEPGPLVRELVDHPFSVIHFENIGETHEAVLNFLARTLTRSELVDAAGKRHGLTNVVFILSLTSIGEVQKKEAAIGFEKKEGQEAEIVIDPKIMKVLDWVDEIIQFLPLSFDHLAEIARQEAGDVVRELEKRFRCRLEIDERVLQAIARGAERSGRFAHFVIEAVERQIRMRALDLVGARGKATCFKVCLEKGQVVFEPVRAKP